MKGGKFGNFSVSVIKRIRFLVNFEIRIIVVWLFLMLFGSLFDSKLFEFVIVF